MASGFVKSNKRFGDNEAFDQPREELRTRQRWEQSVETSLRRPSGTVSEQDNRRAEATAAGLPNLFSSNLWLRPRGKDSCDPPTNRKVSSLYETRCKTTYFKSPKEDICSSSYMKSKLHLDLEVCHNFIDPTSGNQPRANENCRKKGEASRRRQGKSALSINSGLLTNRNSSKLTTNEVVTSKINPTSYTAYNADIKLNNSANKKDRAGYDNDQDLRPIILNLSQQIPTPIFSEWLGTVQHLYVETSVKKRRRARRLACQTFNRDPSQQVVVWTVRIQPIVQLRRVSMGQHRRTWRPRSDSCSKFYSGCCFLGSILLFAGRGPVPQSPIRLIPDYWNSSSRFICLTKKDQGRWSGL